jgi:hypothetical protein
VPTTKERARKRAKDPENGSAPSTFPTTILPAASPSGLVVGSDANPVVTAGELVQRTRTEMKDEMSCRLRQILLTVRTGVMAEMTDLSTDLNETLLTEMANRLQAINRDLEAGVAKVLMPALRKRAADLKGQLATLYRQLLPAPESAEAGLEAERLAGEAVEELVPNLR